MDPANLPMMQSVWNYKKKQAEEEKNPPKIDMRIPWKAGKNWSTGGRETSEHYKGMMEAIRRGDPIA